VIQLFQGYFECMTVEYRRKWLLFFFLSAVLLDYICICVSVVVWDCVARRAGRGQKKWRGKYF